LYGKKSKEIAEAIENEINYFFYTEQVNESGIRTLKLRLEKLGA